MTPEKGMYDGTLAKRLRESLSADLEPFCGEDLKSLTAKSISASFFKKYLPEDGDTSKQDTLALEKFLAINVASESWVPPNSDDLYFRFIGEVENALSHIPDDFGPLQVFDRLECGPGANRSVYSETYFRKFSENLSASSQGLVQLYKSCVGISGGLTLGSEMSRSKDRGFRIQRGNRLFFVPKNAEISRTCCTENLLDMIFQQAIGSWLQLCLDQHFGIRLSTEPDHNRELARLGSIDGRFATIDLTSASDSEPRELVTRMFRTKKQFFGMMQSCRSDTSILPDGSSVLLGMYSTMGNGFTFPLQTLTFACAVSAVFHAYGRHLPRGRARNWGVFGDDIVCPNDLFRPLCYLLGILGFSVNASKSFDTGNFRESCGHDYHSGSNIRGVYIRTLKTAPERYSAYNRTALFSAKHQVPLFRTLEVLKDTVEDLRIPFFEDDAGGIKVPLSSAGKTVRCGPFRNFRYKKLCFKSSRITFSRSVSLARGNEDLILMSCVRGDFCTPPTPLGTAPPESVVSIGSRFGGKWGIGIGFTPNWDYAGCTDKAVFQSWKTLMDLVW